MNLKTNPEAVFSAYRVLEFQEMNGAYGWNEWLSWLETEKTNNLPEDMLQEMRKDIVASVYGNGGWSRYHVLGDGTVEFSAIHSDNEGIQKAKEVGFSIG